MVNFSLLQRENGKAELFKKVRMATLYYLYFGLVFSALLIAGAKGFGNLNGTKTATIIRRCSPPDHFDHPALSAILKSLSCTNKSHMRKTLALPSVTISYEEFNTEGEQTWYFLHGIGGSTEFWKEQQAILKTSAHRIVIFDLPGHGLSSIVPQALCNLPSLGKIMASAIHQLQDGRPFMLVGSSLGTNVIAEALYEGLHPAGIILFGPCLVGPEATPADIVKSDSHAGVVFQSDYTAQELNSYWNKTSYRRDMAHYETFAQAFADSNANSRKWLGETIFSGLHRNQISILREMNIPTLLVFGDDEKVIHSNYLDLVVEPLPVCEIVRVPQASHLVQFDRPDVANELIVNFSKRLLK